MPHSDPTKRAEYQAAWYAANREKVLAQTRVYDAANYRRRSEYGSAYRAANRTRKRGYHLKRYGLTPEDVSRMSEAQNHQCAICKNKRPLVVDHCHTTDRVRGLLCTQCNCALGLMGDSTDALRQAQEYLKEHQ